MTEEQKKKIDWKSLISSADTLGVSHPITLEKIPATERTKVELNARFSPEEQKNLHRVGNTVFVEDKTGAKKSYDLDTGISSIDRGTLTIKSRVNRDPLEDMRYEKEKQQLETQIKDSEGSMKATARILSGFAEKFGFPFDRKITSTEGMLSIPDNLFDQCIGQIDKDIK